jgi:hypothetical protein
MKTKKKGKKSCSTPSSSSLSSSSSSSSSLAADPDGLWRSRLRGNTDPSRDLLVKSCKKYLDDKHCTLWQNWLLEPDKIEDDGTVTKKGLTLAAEWLADQIIAVLALTVRTGNPTLITDATRVQEGATPHG